MPNVQYPDSVPVDEPVAPMPRAKVARKPMPVARPKARPVQYPDSVPVDEPVSPVAKPFKKGGSIDGIAQRGKTKGRLI